MAKILILAYVLAVLVHCGRGNPWNASPDTIGSNATEFGSVVVGKNPNAEVSVPETVHPRSGHIRKKRCYSSSSCGCSNQSPCSDSAVNPAMTPGDPACRMLHWTYVTDRTWAQAKNLVPVGNLANGASSYVCRCEMCGDASNIDHTIPGYVSKD